VIHHRRDGRGSDSSRDLARNSLVGYNNHEYCREGVGWLTSRRDRANKIAEIRLQYLIDVYDKLAHTANRTPTPETSSDFERAIEKIQLFGSPEEVALVHKLQSDWNTVQPDGKPRANIDPLLFALRNRLRNELGLARVDSKIIWFRVMGGAQ
jgi:hypothetical protein